MSARTAGFSGLTIRSSRVRFAASSRCGKLVHLAAAATLLGLAQALAECGQSIKRKVLNLLLHSFDRGSQERLAGLDQRQLLTLYVI